MDRSAKIAGAQYDLPGVKETIGDGSSPVHLSFPPLCIQQRRPFEDGKTERMISIGA